MSQFIEDLVRPYVLDAGLDDGYRAMAEDKDRELEAQEWCNSLIEGRKCKKNRGPALASDPRS